jgi:CheY-like chemotaxis protein
MGGEIGVTSVLGEGSTFTVCVPAELPARAATQAGGGRSGPVLVIDDDSATHEQVQRAVHADGARGGLLPRAAQGLAVARSVHPQAIVLGVSLAEDSWDTLTQMRGDVGLRSVPVVVASLLDEQARALAAAPRRTSGSRSTGRRLRAVLASLRGG